MYLIFFLFWVIFNGRFTLEICLFGVAIAALIYWFICKFMDWSPKKDLILIRMSGFFFRYFFILIWEIVKANMETIRLIFSVRYEREPVLVTFDTKLKNPFFQVILANSITLTPGTITVSLKEQTYTVHALDKDFAKGIEQSIFVKMLEKAERIVTEGE